jgi:hypothetical protein
LQDVIAVARPNLSNEEIREPEGLLAEYRDIFVMDDCINVEIWKGPDRFARPR